MRMGDDHSSAFALFFLVAGFAAFWYFYIYDRPITNVPSVNTTTTHPVVVYGGSLSHGAGALQNGGYAKVLSESVSTNITIVAEPNLRVQKAWSSIDHVTNLAPQVVIVELGPGDLIIPETPYRELYARLERIINAIHESGSSVILIEHAGYGHLYRDLSREYQTALVTNPLRNIIGSDAYMFDATNPNDQGHEIIAQSIKPVLLKILSQQ